MAPESGVPARDVPPRIAREEKTVAAMLRLYGKKPESPGACAGGERPYQHSSRLRTDQAGFFLGISPADG